MANSYPDAFLFLWRYTISHPNLVSQAPQIVILIQCSFCCCHYSLVCISVYQWQRSHRPLQVIPQSYVSTLSNISATSFQFTLQLSLGTAFVQYLWYLLRVRAFQTSTIENLFSIRTSPFKLLHLSSLRGAPLLVSLAILIWTIYISTSFPPGAISIETKINKITKPSTVLTFNASYVSVLELLIFLSNPN